MDEFRSVVQPILTDLYQVTMAYAYWKSGKINDDAVFDLFFRKNPFKGEFTIFAGLDECLKVLDTFKYSETDIAYLRTILPSTCEEEFFKFLANLSPGGVRVVALPEGSVCFPRIPIIKVYGPLIMVQLLETIFLNLVNYASLVATNAARFRIAAGKHMKLLEFGLRRAQGPNGGLSASKYSYLGGFDATSNVLAGKLFGIPVSGTHAHSFVTSFNSLDQVSQMNLKHNKFEAQFSSDSWANNCLRLKKDLAKDIDMQLGETNEGEFAAFISFAASFPTSFLALVDTYDVVRSGIPNFCAVALALHELGYKPLGIRIDSGDLAYLSSKVREVFTTIANVRNLPWFSGLEIVASNDINEETIISLNEQGHSINCFGIGTHLVTCQKQPALGCVFKMVSVKGEARIKLSQDREKITLPGDKEAFRLYGKDGLAILDLLQLPDEDDPHVGQKVLCRHPFEESKRAWVTPIRVEQLHCPVWPRQLEEEALHQPEDLNKVRERVNISMKTLRSDHVRSFNPTPYKVSVSDKLYAFIHRLWMANAPIGELS